MIKNNNNPNILNLIQKIFILGFIIYDLTIIQTSYKLLIL